MRKKASGVSYVVASLCLFAGVNAADGLIPIKANANPVSSHNVGPAGFPLDQGCVAWKTHERLFFVYDREVMGANCKVTSSLQRVSPGLYRFEMLVPVDGFRSGSSTRDREVQRILKGQRQPNLFFTTDAHPIHYWRKLLRKGEMQADGYLSIAGDSHPIHTTIHSSKAVHGYTVYGSLKTRFEELGLQPPVVFGGVLVKVDPSIELVWQIPTDETVNFRQLAAIKD